MASLSSSQHLANAGGGPATKRHRPRLRASADAAARIRMPPALSTFRSFSCRPNRADRTGCPARWRRQTTGCRDPPAVEGAGAAATSSQPASAAWQRLTPTRRLKRLPSHPGRPSHGPWKPAPRRLSPKATRLGSRRRRRMSPRAPPRPDAPARRQRRPGRGRRAVRPHSEIARRRTAGGGVFLGFCGGAAPSHEMWSRSACDAPDASEGSHQRVTEYRAQIKPLLAGVFAAVERLRAPLASGREQGGCHLLGGDWI